MDIGPFFIIINYILSKYILEDLLKLTIIKIHTKTDEKWRNILITQILNVNNNIEVWNNERTGIYIPLEYKYKLDSLNKKVTINILNKLNIANIFYNFNYNEYYKELERIKKLKESKKNKIKPKVIIKKKENYNSITNPIEMLNFDYNFYKEYNKIKCYYDNEADNKIFLDYHWNNIGKFKKLPYNEKQINNVKNEIQNNKLEIVIEEKDDIIPDVNIIVKSKYDNLFKMNIQKEYFFSAGTMFWMKGSLINDFFSNFDFKYHLNLMEPGYTLNTYPTYVHSWERLLCLIAYVYNYDIIDKLL